MVNLDTNESVVARVVVQLPRVRALYFIQFDDGFCLLCLSQGVEFFDEKLNALFMAWLLDHGIYPVSTFYLYHVLVHCMSY